jgi:hypothetical protein
VCYFKLPKKISAFLISTMHSIVVVYRILIYVRCFAIVMSSWDPKGAQDLPGCMKFALEKILDSYQTITNMLHREDKYRMTYLRHFVRYLTYFVFCQRNMFN